MKGLETGKDKIQKICDTLKKETLDPAKQEAREIVENAHIQAADIVAAAKKNAEKIMATAVREIEEKKKVLHSSLTLACRQAIEQLKQTIEKELFNKELAQLVASQMNEPKIIAEILQSFIKMLENKGINDELTVTIPKSIAPRSITSLLASHVLERLNEQNMKVGDFAGGLEIGLKDKQITIAITDEIVRELIAQYVRRDLRDLIFNV